MHAPDSSFLVHERDRDPFCKIVVRVDDFRWGVPFQDQHEVKDKRCGFGSDSRWDFITSRSSNKCDSVCWVPHEKKVVDFKFKACVAEVCSRNQRVCQKLPRVTPDAGSKDIDLLRHA